MPFAFANTHSTDELPARFFPVAATSVIDEDDRPVVAGSGASGVLAYSGPMPIGYYKDSPTAPRTFRSIRGVRYAVPGDLAQLEPDGAIRFLGRGSGVISTGGEKVHPQEVEEALLSHPHVIDAAVAGDADEVWGQRVGAVIVTSDAVSDAQLQAWVRRSLAGYKVPRVIAVRPG